MSINLMRAPAAGRLCQLSATQRVGAAGTLIGKPVFEAPVLNLSVFRSSWATVRELTMDFSLDDARGLLRPYYGLRLALIAGYFVLRASFPLAAAQKPSSFLPAGLTQEVDMLILVAMIVGQRFRNVASPGEAVDTAIFYALALEGVLLYLTDLSAFLGFVFAFAALAAALPKPLVDCGGLVRRLSPLDAFRLLPGGSVSPDRRVGDGGHGYPADEEASRALRTAATQPPPGPRTIVVIARSPADHVLGAVSGIARARQAALGSSGGPADPVSFAFLDASRYGDIASSDLGVDAGLFSMQLSAVLEVAGGRVTRRLPPVATDGTVTTVKLDAAGLRRFFHLDC